MKYGSVCSGIEAASAAWHPLGWTAEFLSEIEKFPSAVLAHHYPDVPNLGDMTKFKEWPDATIDVLVGGTPCQSFSVAGLRKGLDDPRGNLMLTYLAIADRYRPQWVVWENVPGVLSTNSGDDFATLLDGLEELGYIVDVDILDAQFFGVAQRRRRVFVCGQHRDSLLNQMTDSSALTIAQCLTEILHSILVNRFPEFAREAENSDWPSLSSDGMKKRMRLFGLHGDAASYEKLRKNLIEANRRCQQEAKSWEGRAGELAAGCTQADLLTALKAEALCLPTDEQLSRGLGDLFDVMKLSTTSIATSITTAQEISLFSAALNIARLIAHLNPLCPSWCDAASSGLTLLQDFTSYARQASSGLFAEPEWLHAGHDLITEAEGVLFTLGHIGVECFGEIFSVADSLQGHPAPRREKGEVSPTIPASGAGTGRTGNERTESEFLQPCQVANCLTARTARTAKGMNSTLNEGQTPVIAPTLLAQSNSTGGHRPPGTTVDTAHSLIPTVTNIDGGNTARTLSARHDGSVCADRGPDVVAIHDTQDPCVSEQAFALGRNSGQENAIAFAQNSRDEVRLQGGDGKVCGALGANEGMKQRTYLAQSVSIRGRDGGATAELSGEVATALRASQGGGDKPHVLHSMQVRRLTPRECERLQGFPDDYTRIPWRSKPADQCPDGPRYKALGNSMAVPVMRWIGERIQAVDELINNER